MAIPRKNTLRWFTTGFVMITSTSLFLYHKNDPLLWRRMNDYLNRRLKTPLILNSIPMRHVPMTYNGMLEEAFTKHWNIHAFFYLRVALRFLQLALYFTPLLLAYPITRLFGQSGRKLWLRFCVFVLERSGPTFIKLGQWASTRPDLMSKEACQIFSKLFDNVSHNSWSSTRTLLRREWKNEIEDLFDEFDQDPIGAGCMAQVYRGRLRDDVAASFETRDVIVKVARPGVDQLVYEDLTLLYLSCRIIHMFPSMTWISLPAQLLEFGALLKQQLDFTQEASNLQNDSSVVFPRPCMELTTEKVLVESFEEGFPIRKLVDQIGDPDWVHHSKNVSHQGLQIFLKMLLFHNFTHADLHPGNIMVRFVKKWPQKSYSQWTFNNPFVDIGELWHSSTSSHRTTSSFDDYDAADSFVPSRAVFDSLPDRIGSLDHLAVQHHHYYQSEVVILDAGLVNQLAGAQFRNFLDMFDALALKQDGALVGRLMVERAPLPENGKVSYEYMPVRLEVFYRRMKKVVDSLDDKGEGTTTAKTKTGGDAIAFNLKSNYLSNVLTEVFQIVREHHVRLDYRFTNLIVSMIILEGMGRQLSPDTDMFEEAKPLLAVALQRWVALWMTHFEDV